MRWPSTCLLYTSPEEYAIKPCNYVPIENGHQFDLGGRVLTAFNTPGHSPDSIMLADDANKLLFTGDTVYPATLYAHLDSHDGLKSVIDTYKTVSYTHLDVYKRQRPLWVRPGSGRTRGGALPSDRSPLLGIRAQKIKKFAKVEDRGDPRSFYRQRRLKGGNARDAGERI